MSLSRVLIVVSEHSLRDVIVCRLKEYSPFDVAAVSTGQEGLLLAQSYEPEFVLIESKLSDIEGLEFCRRLRTLAKLQTARILMLVEQCSGLDELVGYGVGVDEFVNVPFKVDALIQLIKRSLQRRNRINVHTRMTRNHD